MTLVQRVTPVLKDLLDLLDLPEEAEEAEELPFLVQRVTLVLKDLLDQKAPEALRVFRVLLVSRVSRVFLGPRVT